MSKRMRFAACVVFGGLCVVCVSLPSIGQETLGDAEVVSAPPATPRATPRAYRPDAKYGPLQAGQNKYERAELERRHAINRQLWIIDDIYRYNLWPPYVHRYALPYIRAYAPPGVGRRVERDLRRIATGRVIAPWPLVPGGIYGYPYYPWVRQPTGHEEIWTGPNSYMYHPSYAPPDVPTPAAPPTPEPPSQPVPPPPTETGPREF